MKNIIKYSLPLSFCGCLMAVLLFFSIAAAADTKGTALELPEDLPAPENARLISAGEHGIFLIIPSEENALLFLLDQEGNILQSLEPSLSANCTDAFGDGETLYLVCPTLTAGDQTRSFTKVIGCGIVDGVLKSTSVVQLKGVFCGSPGTLVKSENSTANFLALSQHKPSSLFLFNRQGVQILEVPTERGEFWGLLRCGNTVFASYSEEKSALGVWDAGSAVPEQDFPLHDSDVPAFPAHVIGDGRAADADGAIFSLDSEEESLRFLFSSGGDPSCAAALDNEIVIRTDSSSAEKFTDEGDTVAQYSVPNGELLSVCAFEDGFFVLVKSGDTLFFGDLEEYRDDPPVPPDESQPDPPEESGSEEPAPEPPTNPEITSSLPIDRENGILILPHPMNFSQLTAQLTIPEDCELSALRPDGSQFTSGNAATGGVLELLCGGETVDRLELVLLGDLDFTGSLTDADEELLYAMLNGEREPSGLLFFAADTDRNGILETADLLRLKKNRRYAQE